MPKWNISWNGQIHQLEILALFLATSIHRGMYCTLYLVHVAASQASLVAQWSRIRLQCRRGGFSPGSGRSPAEGNGNPFQYSCLENPMIKSCIKSQAKDKSSGGREEPSDSAAMTLQSRGASVMRTRYPHSPAVPATCERRHGDVHLCKQSCHHCLREEETLPNKRALWGRQIPAYRGDEGLCVDFSRNQRGADNEDQLFVFSKKPLCVMGCLRKLPVLLRSNSDKNHQAFKLNVMVINSYLYLTYSYVKWMKYIKIFHFSSSFK